MTDNEIFKELYKSAIGLTAAYTTGTNIDVGGVGCAIYSDSGNMYRGISVDMDCGLGVCAERIAIFNMLTNGDADFTHICVLGINNSLMVPCGACMEVIKRLKPSTWKQVKILIGYPEIVYKRLGDV